ncbi:MAG: cell division protein FtsQ/DivIB [Yoonia sp.]|nr:cell division protein FtsQ/DivIB [Yoonia sp.]
MRPLTATRRHRALPRDPAPSKWKYRYQRMMLTPGFRGMIRVGVPLALITIIAVSWYSHDENREMAAAKLQKLKEGVQQRPEFMVASLDVTGADDALTTTVLAQLPVAFPISSFDLDLEAMRTTVEALDAVRSARVRVGDAGVLNVDITPRTPVALWRDGLELRLLDEEGTFAGFVANRAERLDLPLIAGDGAQTHIAEALALFRDAKPIAERVRGLVRMGERRWDVVLDRDQRILLPGENPVAALDRVIVLHQARDMLDRDVAVVDMRNGDRPTLRMNKEAADAFRRVSHTEADN